MNQLCPLPPDHRRIAADRATKRLRLSLARDRMPLINAQIAREFRESGSTTGSKTGNGPVAGSK